MVEDKRVESLRGLRLGDKVCITSYSGNLYGYRVTKITPSGRVVVSNLDGDTMTFAPSGIVLGGSDSVDSYRVQPYDYDEHYTYIYESRKAQLLSAILEIANDFRRVSVNPETLVGLERTGNALRSLRDSLLN